MRLLLQLHFRIARRRIVHFVGMIHKIQVLHIAVIYIGTFFDTCTLVEKVEKIQISSFISLFFFIANYRGTINTGQMKNSTLALDFNCMYTMKMVYCSFHISFIHFLFALDPTNVQWWLLTNWNDAIVQFSIGISWKDKNSSADSLREKNWTTT